MVKSKSDFPHPVLSMDGEDYIKECTFGCFLGEDVLEDEQHIEFLIGYHLACDFLQRLVQDEQAIVMAYIESPNASFRRICKFPKGENEIKVKVLNACALKLLFKERLHAPSALKIVPRHFCGDIIAVARIAGEDLAHGSLG